MAVLAGQAHLMEHMVLPRSQNTACRNVANLPKGGQNASLPSPLSLVTQCYRVSNTVFQNSTSVQVHSYLSLFKINHTSLSFKERFCCQIQFFIYVLNKRKVGGPCHTSMYTDHRHGSLHLSRHLHVCMEI